MSGDPGTGEGASESQQIPFATAVPTPPPPPPPPFPPPPQTLATPEVVRFAPGEPERWYLPDWAETVRLLGWRVILFLPAAGLVVLLLLIPLRPGYILWLLLSWWKMCVFLVLVPTIMAVERVKNTIRSRTDPFCIHCGYGLTGLPPAHVCPECGSAYTPELIEEYRRDPHRFIERYRANRKIAERTGTPGDAPQ